MSQLLFSGVFSERFCEGALCGPPPDKSVVKRRPLYTNLVRPLGNSLRLSAEGNNPAVAPIVHLLLGGGPFAIFWKVSKIVINSVYRCVFRALAHVGQKILKLSPAFTYYNASSKISFAAINTRITASGNHRAPRGISRSFGHPVSGVCDSSGVIDLLPVEAPARLTTARAKVIACCDVPVPALTKTQPCEIAPSNAMLAKHREPLEYLPSEINSVSHEPI